MLNQFKLKTMTYFYYKTTKTWNGQPQYKQMTNSEEETIDLWKHLSDKKNWRIVQLPNGYYQTEYRDPQNCGCKGDDCNCDTWYDVTRRETLESAEAAIDGSVEHYGKKLEFVKGPKVVKTFK
tara:strand:- start:560 stop:928 length:369 start_codon:yes stop_codon:yes gene_type:complete